jgi:DNA polymerase III subunit beta
MHIHIQNQHFRKAIADVSRVVSSKSPFPSLTGIKLTADDHKLTLIGSNSTTIIKKEIPASEDTLVITEPGSIIIPAVYLYELVKKLPQDLSIHVDENHSITIRSKDILTRMKGLNPYDYPPLPELNHDSSIEIESGELVQLIKQTAFAVSSNDTRPVLTGVHFSIQKDELITIATNSHRLALKKHKISSTIKGDCIVPSAALFELNRLIEKDCSPVNILITDHYIVFTTADMSFYSRLIEGSYPDTSSLIPNDSKTTVTLNTSDFLEGVDRACLFAKEWRNHNIQLELMHGSHLKISSRSSEIGKIKELQKLSALTGDNELILTLDGRFLMEALKSINEDEVSLCFSGSMRPVLIHPVDNLQHLQLISPVRAG